MKGAEVDLAVWITQLLLMSALIAVIAAAGAPPRDGRESPSAREEFDDLVYRLRGFATRLKSRWQRCGTRKKRPPRR